CTFGQSKSYLIANEKIMNSASIASFPIIPPVLVQGETLFNLTIATRSQLAIKLNVVTNANSNAIFTMVPSIIDCTTNFQQNLSLQVQSASASIGNYTLQFITADTDITLYSTNVLVVPWPTSFPVTSSQWSGMPIFNETFRTLPFGTVPNASNSIWQSIKHGFVSNTCTKASGNALYFTHLYERTAQTVLLDLKGYDLLLSFTYIYGYLPNQTYDNIGNNTLSCVQVQPSSQFNIEYLVNNATPWQIALQVPIPVAPSAQLQNIVLPLPPSASSIASAFRWIQPNQTSGRVGSIRGTRYQWQYRNLFDQWAIDNVLLTGRVQAPVAITSALFPALNAMTVQLVANATRANILVSIGDGSHPFPQCNFTHLANITSFNNSINVSITATSIIHAVTCVYPNQQSFGYRSPRYWIQSPPPTIISTKANDSLGYYTVNVTMPRPTMVLRFTFGNGNDTPSCTYGNLIKLSSNSTMTSLVIKSNGILQALACQDGLLGSNIVQPPQYIVQPSPPSFNWTNPSNVTTTPLFNVTVLVTSNDSSLVIATAQVQDTTSFPQCNNLSSGIVIPNATYSMQLQPNQMIRAVSCCISSYCNDSNIVSYGPINITAAIPTISTTCSTTAMVTSLVTLVPGTTTGFVKYAINSNAVDCNSLGLTYPGTPISVSKPSNGAAVVVTAITCVPGLQPSAPLIASIPLQDCCANAISFPSSDPSLDCSQMLLFRDVFTSCNLSAWTATTTQFGGKTSNGGVNIANVQCTFDSTLNQSVLALVANGDNYSCSVPTGVVMASDGSLLPRNPTDLFSNWALPNSPPIFPCNPRESTCAAHRVGASISTLSQWNAAIVSFSIKSCREFGTMSDIWLQNITQLITDVNAMSTSYIAYMDLWKANLNQIRSPPPFPDVVYSNSITDPLYHRIVIQWNSTEGRANLYRDGQLIAKTRYLPPTTNIAALTFNVWFPNAWAGIPLFNSCTTNIANVQVVKLQAAAGRWCEWENNIVPCSSDSDCNLWVKMNCLMPLAVSICYNSLCKFQMDPTFGSGTVKANNMQFTN
ncbi:hypothetical protein THRCLA_08481, partial [Thraustotheca clavata]